MHTNEQRLERGNKTPRYLRSHPPAKDRANHLRKVIAELEATPRPPRADAAPVIVDLAPILGALPEAVIAPNRLHPLAVDNEWQYDVLAGGIRTPCTVRVASALSTPGGTVYRVETLRTGGAPTAHYAFTTETAAWRKPIGPGDWTAEWLFPADPDNPVTAGGARFTFVGTEAVTTPYGSFPDAVHIRREVEGPGGRTQDLWFAEGVGLVRRTTADPEVSEVLVRYNMKSAAAGQS